MTTIVQNFEQQATEARRQMLAAAFFIDAIGELEQYLQSPKFHIDPTVQVQDILNRIAEARTRAHDVADDLGVRIPK